MSTFGWILLGGFLMSSIAMVGAVTIVMKSATLERILLPLVALAAGTLLGGALLHMLPQGMAAMDPLHAAVWILAGFAAFLFLEQFLHWHHSHRAPRGDRQPVTYLVLIGDGLHNFLGGIAVASTFLVDPRAGVMAWLAAAAHEVPQEMGDFGVLVHGGFSRRRALLWNFVSALTFPVGAVLAWFLARQVDLAGLVLFGAGNFIYIAASDLVPEIKQSAERRRALANSGFLLLGLGLMALLAFGFGPGD